MSAIRSLLLEHVADELSLTPTRIQQVTATYYGVKVEDLQAGRFRSQTIVNARHVARYLERLAGKSFPQIGKDYLCDHSTVMASVKHMTERLAANDARYVNPVACISAQLAEDAAVVEVRRAERVAVLSLEAAAASRVAEAMKCPTCGAPVIKELQRQIAELHAKIEKLNGHGGSNGAREISKQDA